MAVLYTGRVSVSVEFSQIASAILAKGVWRPSIAADIKLPNGTSTGQCDLAWGVKTSGIGATTTVYDLAGTLTDLEGNAITFVEVTDVMVRNLSATAANYLVVGPDATAGFGVLASNVGFWAAAIGSGGGSIVPADYNSSDGDGSWCYHHSRTGVAVAAGSTDELSVVTAGASANTWELIVIGRTA